MDFADLPERKNPLRFNIAIPSGDIGKLLVLPRFSRSPRERHKINDLAERLPADRKLIENTDRFGRAGGCGDVRPLSEGTSVASRSKNKRARLPRGGAAPSGEWGWSPGPERRTRKNSSVVSITSRSAQKFRGANECARVCAGSWRCEN
jgi:hypothetical protein